MEQSSKDDTGRFASQEPHREAGSLETDIQRLIEAVGGVAVASAQPLTNALRVIGQNVGSKGSVAPRVRFHGLERSGSELLGAVVQLTENIVNLSLQVLSGPASTHASPNRGSSARTQPGERLRLPMSVENPGKETMSDLRFEVLPITGPEGHVLPASSVRLEPEVLHIAPGDFEKLLVEVQIPSDAPSGSYRGELKLTDHKDFTLPFEFLVQSKTT